MFSVLDPDTLTPRIYLMSCKKQKNNMKCTCVFTDKESGLGSQSMSSYFEIITEPLQTISKTYSYKTKQLNQRIELQIRLHTNQECAWLFFGTKIQKAKYQYTEVREDTLCKKDKNTGFLL